MSEHKSRHTGKIACLAVIAAFAANTAFAQAAKWPERTITIVVASQPGAAPDVLARLVAEPLGTRLGQTVIVENRPGASGGIGAGFVVRAEPDGYTLLMMTPVHSYGPAITPQTKYDPVKSFAPVSMIASVPLIMVSTPQIGAKTVSEFVDHAKKNPGKLNYSSPGMGTLQHLATVRFMKQAGIDMVHVPYKSGADAVVSLLGNTNHLFFSGMPPALPHVKTGKLQALAVTTAKRTDSAPDVPTMKEAGFPEITVDNWHALVAPAGTPAAVVARFEKEIAAVLEMPAVKEGFFNSGSSTWFLSAKDLGNLIADESKKWTEAAKEAGLAVSK